MSTYRFNPYSMSNSKEFIIDPTFIKYTFGFQEQQQQQFAMPPKDTLQRLFIGQLPHGTTQEQLTEILAYIGILYNLRGGLMYLEPIIKWNNGRSPCGCAHVWVFPEDANAICQALNKQYLLRATGFFVAPPKCVVVGSGPQCPIVVEYARSMYHSTVEGRRIVRRDILKRQNTNASGLNQNW